MYEVELECSNCGLRCKHNSDFGEFYNICPKCKSIKTMIPKDRNGWGKFLIDEGILVDAKVEKEKSGGCLGLLLIGFFISIFLT